MHIEILSVQQWNLIRFPDRIDALNVQAFVSAIENQVEANTRIAFDMRHVEFINYQALRYLYQVANEMNQTGGQVALVGPSEKMKRQFTLFTSIEPFRIISSYDWSRLTAGQKSAVRPPEGTV